MVTKLWALGLGAGALVFSLFGVFSVKNAEARSSATSPLIDLRTKAQLQATSPALGQLALCTDCAQPYSLCIGTGTSVNQWAKVYSGAIDTAKRGCGTGQ